MSGLLRLALGSPFIGPISTSANCSGKVAYLIPSIPPPMTYQDHLAQLSYFPTPDGNMAYLDQGEGEVILLLHGVPTSSWLYRHITPLLVQAGYRVIAPDMLGYGASDKPEGYELYANAEMARRLLDLMDQLQIEQWTHVFHDGGGLYTWELLRQCPERVKRLVMMNTIVYQAGFKPPMKFEPGLLAKAYVRQYCAPLGQRIVIHGTFKNGVKAKEVVTDDMLAGYKEPFLNAEPHSLYYFFTQTCRKIDDYSELHQSLDMPLTVIWGQHDHILVWEHIAEEVKRYFNLQEQDIHILDARHFIQEEKPEEIVEIILDKMED